MKSNCTTTKDRLVKLLILLDLIFILVACSGVVTLLIIYNMLSLLQSGLLLICSNKIRWMVMVMMCDMML